MVGKLLILTFNVTEFSNTKGESGSNDDKWGKIVAEGTPSEIMENMKSITGRYLSSHL